MDFVDNVIERATGTIRGRAQFANADGLFTTGMFGRIQIASSAPYEALLVPDEAIGTEQARKYVLVVGSDDVARQKFVTLGDVRDGLRVIKSGSMPNDRVIVDRSHEGAGGWQGHAEGAGRAHRRRPLQQASSK